MGIKKWVQIKSFNPKMMGYTQGFALSNVRRGFEIMYGTYESAIKDMKDQKLAGTLHDMDSLPRNIDVPIYAWPKKKIYSTYGFVFVIDKNGSYFADGKKVGKGYAKSLKNRFNLYWAECVDGVRVIAEEEVDA